MHLEGMCKIQIKVNCPHCDSPKIKKNGVKGNGKQNFYCKNCRKQFQHEYVYRGANPQTQRRICVLALRGNGIRDLSVGFEVSATTVLRILRRWFARLTEPEATGHYPVVIIDEFWSFVGKRKAGKRWVWYAICGRTGKILAFHIGKRNDASCQKLMRKLAHLQIDCFCTDAWKSYQNHIPPDKHYIGKDATWKIERKNLNFRTHLKRLARKTICFSKKDDMHYGIIKAYIHQTNTKICAENAA